MRSGTASGSFPPIADVPFERLTCPMSEPWFERDGIFPFRPVTRQGRVLLRATHLCMLLSLGIAFFTQPDSIGWWISGLFGMLSFLVGYTIVLWKMDWNYGRR